MNDWKKIWNNREIPSKEFNTLNNTDDVDLLLKVDGFDSGTGKISALEWIEFVKKIQNRLNIGPDSSIFEVGCGAGAFLYPFFKLGNKIGGLDYSERLIQFCKSIYGESDFICSEATSLNTNIQYDYTSSFSVFFYFPDYNYANIVLDKMIKKATKGVLILDIPDIDKKDECEKFRRGTMSEYEYNKKYTNLSHLYYSKNFFYSFAQKINASEIILEDQSINNYVNNRFRFNCFIKL